MPTYTSTNSTAVFSGEPYIRFAPNTTTITDKYIKVLPTGITLTDHEPTVSPWTLLAEVTTTPMATPVNVYEYDNLVIYNASDDVAMISANEDDANSYPTMSSSTHVFSNDERLFGCIEVTSMGTGSVFIYGVR